MKKILVMLLALTFVLSLGISGLAEDVFADDTPWTLETMETFGVKLPPYLQSVPVRQRSEEPLRFCFLYYKNNTFWGLIEEGALAAQEYYKNFNVELDLVVIGNEINNQAFQGAMNTAVLQGYDGIICSPQQEGSEVIVNSAVDAGVQVTTYCAEPQNPVVPQKRIAFMGSEQNFNTQQYVDYIIQDNNGEPCKIGLISAYLGVGSYDIGTTIFIDKLNEQLPGCEFIGPYEGKDQAELCYNWAKDLLTAHPDMKYIKVVGGGASGAAKAVMEAGMTGQVKVLCNDEVIEHLMYLRTGEIGMICMNNPSSYAFDCVTILYNYIVAGELPDYENWPYAEETNAVETHRLAGVSVILTKDNVDQFFPE